MDKVQHGEPRTYQRGCRCLPCRRANALRCKQYRARTKNCTEPIRVSALATRRYLEDLMLRGWSLRSIAAELGGAYSHVAAYRFGRVTVETERKVKELWARLILLPEPSGQGAAQARNYARKLGAIPVALYDDPSDPDEFPDERQAA